jgi:glucans biosynthesis protein
MRRREVFPVMAGFTIWAAGLPSRTDAAPAAAPAFQSEVVRQLARDLARKPYQPPDKALPDELNNLTYSQYQMLRFNKNQALWHDYGARFKVEFFHRGYIFKDRVTISQVVDGKAIPVAYSADMFTVDKLPSIPKGDLGFAGFRVHFPLNRPDYFDEVCTFLGASYFRALAKGQGYGQSARGLSIKTGDPGGEEFPVFKQFWLERPAKDSNVLVIHALLDGPSAAAAFRFTLRPGDETVMDTQLALYPRVDLAHAGLAPMTSMFLFDANNRTGYDDYRAAVHDTNGLGMLRGTGERVWRTLNNPRRLQISVFDDAGTRGFGLEQRKRMFADFEDIEAAYQHRPSLWMESIGDWGQGAVTLVEIPSDREVNDNIVAFWRPADALAKGGEYIYAYRLHWCWDPPPLGTPLAKVTQTRVGLTFDHKDRQFVVDFAGPPLKALPAGQTPDIDLGADKGKVQNATLERVPDDSAWRLAFQLVTGGESAIELRARLTAAGKPLSETWLYRWTA